MNIREKIRGRIEQERKERNDVFNRSLPFSFFLFPFSLNLSLLAEVRIDDFFWFQGDEPAKTAFSPTGGINKFISDILPNVYTVAGLFLFGLVLFGGFHYLTGAGDEEKLKKGKAILTSALLGFAILFGSFWIIQIIQVLTGVPILSPSI